MLKRVTRVQTISFLFSFFFLFFLAFEHDEVDDQSSHDGAYRLFSAFRTTIQQLERSKKKGAHLALVALLELVINRFTWSQFIISFGVNTLRFIALLFPPQDAEQNWFPFACSVE